jgi:hypothetical protein
MNHDVLNVLRDELGEVTNHTGVERIVHAGRSRKRRRRIGARR